MADDAVWSTGEFKHLSVCDIVMQTYLKPLVRGERKIRRLDLRQRGFISQPDIIHRSRERIGQNHPTTQGRA